MERDDKLALVEELAKLMAQYNLVEAIVPDVGTLRRAITAPAERPLSVEAQLKQAERDESEALFWSAGT